MTATAREARLFARYLLGVDIPPELVGRYCRGVRHVGGTSAGRALRLVRRIPALLPFLDAVTALLRPEDPLRRRLLLMTAILEATPAHADRFLGRRVPVVPLAGAAAWLAGRAVAKLLLGLGLLIPLGIPRSGSEGTR